MTKTRILDILDDEVMFGFG